MALPPLRLSRAARWKENLKKQGYNSTEFLEEQEKKNSIMTVVKANLLWGHGGLCMGVGRPMVFCGKKGQENN
jgi:NADH:ubiquinone oxidoreductase subunit F (NADH-binding)